MIDIEVIDDPAAAMVALDPVRSRLLAALHVPASAAALASKAGLTRQKVNYHLKALEACGLVKVAEKRRWGGLTERLLVATAASYVVSPAAMGPAAVDPGKEADRLSAGCLIALAARLIREVGGLLRKARQVEKRLPTLSIDAEVTFRSPEERADFARDLTESVAQLVARYHAPGAPGGRPHRLVVAAHPLPPPDEESQAESPQTSSPKADAPLDVPPSSECGSEVR